MQIRLLSLEERIGCWPVRVRPGTRSAKSPSPVAGMNIATIGTILMVVGIIGLVISVATVAGYAPWGAGNSVRRLLASASVPGSGGATFG